MPPKYATEEERLAAKHASQRAASTRYRQRHPDRSKARMQRYKDKYPERVAGFSRSYHAKASRLDPEKYRKRANAQYAKHKTKRLLRQKDYYWSHREERIAYNHAYYVKTHEHIWLARAVALILDPKRAAQLAAKRLYESKRRARKLGLPDTFTTDQREFMYTYWHHACAICGNQEGFYWTLADDHWIPLASPDCPGTIATNMLPLCHGKMGCNTRKQWKTPSEWLLKRFGIHKARRIEKAIAAYFMAVRERFGSAESSLEAAD